VYAPATLGQLLREFSHGHNLQLPSLATSGEAPPADNY
jgi:hypothetical protein